MPPPWKFTCEKESEGRWKKKAGGSSTILLPKKCRDVSKKTFAKIDIAYPDAIMKKVQKQDKRSSYTA